MQYAMTKLYFRDPPSPESWGKANLRSSLLRGQSGHVDLKLSVTLCPRGEGLVWCFSSFCSHKVYFNSSSNQNSTYKYIKGLHQKRQPLLQLRGGDNTSRFCHFLASLGAENGKNIKVQVNFAQNLNFFVIKLSKLY